MLLIQHKYANSLTNRVIKNMIVLPISSLVFAIFFCRFIRETLTTNKINFFEQNSKVLNPLCSNFLIPNFLFSLSVRSR